MKYTPVSTAFTFSLFDDDVLCQICLKLKPGLAKKTKLSEIRFLFNIPENFKTNFQ